MAHLAVPSSVKEASDVIPSAPTLRPATIFTSAAVSGSQAALDVGVMAPDACGAGDDCCDAIFQRKLKDYGAYLDEMRSHDIRYIPLAFSSYGRMHAEASCILERMAQRAAQRHGIRNPRAILRRTFANIAVAIWDRAAAMIQSCLPELGGDELQILFGSDDGDEMGDPASAKWWK